MKNPPYARRLFQRGTRRGAAYLAAITAASMMFSVWAICVEMSSSVGQAAGLSHVIGLAVSELPALVIGAGALMLLPWWMVISMADRLRQSSLAFFMVAGASTSFIVVITVSATLLRHPTTSFVHRLGLVMEGRWCPLLLAGAAAGLTYWVFAGKNDKLPH